MAVVGLSFVASPMLVLSDVLLAALAARQAGRLRRLPRRRINPADTAASAPASLKAQ